MKTSKIHLLAITFLLGISFVACKKDSSPYATDSATSSSQVAAIQNGESQDAITTKVEQDADNKVDALESSDFNVSETKSGTANGVTVTVDHPDTTYFPKVVTLTYNYADTVNGEYMAQTGVITITVDTVPVGKKLWWRKHVIRTFVFDNFSVTNDSSSFTVSGNRTMKRQAWIPTLSVDKKALKVEIKDTIYSNLTIGVKYGAYTGSFTRNVNRSRDIVVNYYKLLATNKVWHQSYMDDSITFKGSITGINLQDSAYSRIITTPLVFTLCPVWPHNMIATGVVTNTEGSKVITITYTADGCKTNVTATGANGKTITIHRKINCNFRKW